MKIIAEIKSGEWICSVEYYELQKYLGLYYDKMDCPKVGNTIDLSKAFNFESKIRDSFKATSDLINNNASVMRAITDGISVCAKSDNNRAKWNVAALQDLNQIKLADCSDKAWELIMNAKEFLK